VRLPVLLLALLLPLAALAQELVAGAGAIRGGGEGAVGLSLSYSQVLYRRLSANLTYLNEGHLPGHHRDGLAAQLWLEAEASPRLALAAGAGPYRYFDTTPAANDAGYADHNDWAMLYSLAATWRPARGRLFYQLRFNHVAVRNGLDTNSLLAGIGMRLDADDQPAATGAGMSTIAARRNELLVLGGRSILNSYEAERAWARGLEYRREFGPILHGSLALLDEGDNGITRRRGLALQGWLEPSFYDEKLTLGVGAGPYLAHDARREDSRAFVGTLLSLTGSYRIGEAWVARATFSRVVTYHHRDADLVLLGFGYRF
jgi:hypothetical protein